jgi:hypothetical protein
LPGGLSLSERHSRNRQLQQEGLSLNLEVLERIGRDWQRRREKEPDRIWIDDAQRMRLWYENGLKPPEVKGQ